MKTRQKNANANSSNSLDFFRQNLETEHDRVVTKPMNDLKIRFIQIFNELPKGVSDIWIGKQPVPKKVRKRRKRRRTKKNGTN